MTRVLFEKVERLQDILVSYSTGGHPTDGEYAQLRHELLTEPSVKDHLPDFVRRFRHLREFWPFSRHAELVVNLAGAIATFLVATWDGAKGDDAPSLGERVPF